MEQLRNYSVSATKISDGKTYSQHYFVLGNYSNHMSGPQPYLVPTGNSKTIWEMGYDSEEGVEIIVNNTYVEMVNFPGSPTSVTAWIPESRLQSWSGGGAVYPASTPIQDEESGGWNNQDIVGVRGLTESSFQWNDLWYRNTRGSIGYVFDNFVTAEAWSRPPVFSGGTIYTRNADGNRNLNTAYCYPDFSGSTINITAHGTGTYLIVSVAGGTYYNAQTPEA